MINKFRSIKNSPYKITCDDKCSICLSPLYKKNKNIIHLEKCLHKYHYDCIDKWLENKNTCPCCRTIQNRKRLMINYNLVNKRRRRIKNIFKECLGL